MDTDRLTLLKKIGITTSAILVLAGIFALLFSIFTGQMGTIIFALLAGALGAEVSIIRRTPKLNRDEVNALSTSWWGLVVPLLAGAVMAGFIYFAFMAGILTGDGGDGLFTSNLFPNFTKPESAEALNVNDLLKIRPVEIKDFGKLVVWCFLSGYSERFVPSLLQSLEQRGGSGDK